MALEAGAGSAGSIPWSIRAPTVRNQGAGAFFDGEPTCRLLDDADRRDPFEQRIAVVIFGSCVRPASRARSRGIPRSSGSPRRRAPRMTMRMPPSASRPSRKPGRETVRAPPLRHLLRIGPCLNTASRGASITRLTVSSTCGRPALGCGCHDATPSSALVMARHLGRTGRDVSVDPLKRSNERAHRLPLRGPRRPQQPYRLAPSNWVILSVDRSTFSAQRRLTATIALPSGLVPSEKGAQPQVLQK